MEPKRVKLTNLEMKELFKETYLIWDMYKDLTLTDEVWTKLINLCCLLNEKYHMCLMAVNMTNEIIEQLDLRNRPCRI